LAQPFKGYEVAARLRPSAEAYPFDLEPTLASVVALEARVPKEAFTAASLGRERLGNGVVIGAHGLVLTMGYLVMEAEQVMLTLNDGAAIQAHVLGADPVTGFGLVQALQALPAPPLALGDSRKLAPGDPVVIAGAGGRDHALAGQVLSRTPFAGYWEYLLDDAIITAPAHPHWSGAALISGQGELVGVGSLSLEGRVRGGVRRPINMFVPSELLAPILDDLACGRRPYPPRPWLGVLAQEVGGEVVLAGVNPGGPASRAELRAGDAILAVGEHPVTDLADFYSRLWALGPAGSTAPLTVRREGDVFDMEVRSMDREALLRRPRWN
jgi:S1-C subfamily serine protease